MVVRAQPIKYLSGSSNGDIQLKTSTRAIGNLEVLVKVTHSGLCGTDVHDRTAGCGLGHEGVGKVLKIGESVTAVKVGVRVGWGWQFSSCGSCRVCIEGYRQYCRSSVGQKYGELEQGAFGNYVIKHQDFVYPIPDEIESIYAGPLQCAGITAYEALLTAGAKPSDRVGIVGLGGIGHLAVQYAKAMGCEPVVFSSHFKSADARKLGAEEFYLMDTEAFALGKDINILLLCAMKMPDLGKFLPCLAPRATIVMLAIQGEPLVIPYMPFLLPGLRIIASTESSRRNHIDALTFAARHGIRPWVQEFPMTVKGLETALDKLAKGEIRYRAVLTAEWGD